MPRTPTEVAEQSPQNLLRSAFQQAQQAVADTIFIRQSTYSQYETGRRAIPVEVVIRLAEFYGTSVDYQLELTDDPRPYPRRKKN